MTSYHTTCELAACEVIKQVGRKIVLGVPIGIGKPIGLINALYRLAERDRSIELTIFTGLTFSRPVFSNSLEKNFVEPILNRLLGNYEDPLYESARLNNALPPNIKVIEFFLSPGKFLHNHYVQQNYISSSYTNVARDLSDLGINVIAQAVVPDATKTLYSLSSNSDLFSQVYRVLRKSARDGHPIAVLGEVNMQLPYMYGENAEIASDLFTIIVDPQHYKNLFTVPREAVSMQDHMIGLYASTLIKDDGCLQVGIGALGNALAYSLIMRDSKQEDYQEILIELDIKNKFAKALEIGELNNFKQGLYASTEMFSDEFIELFNHQILRKKVYDHVGLQRLLNTKKITHRVDKKLIEILLANNIINSALTQHQLDFLIEFGIFKDEVKIDGSNLVFSTHSMPNNLLSFDDNNFSLLLGDELKSGKIMHAGFFFGSKALYSTLHQLSKEKLALIEMTSIDRTNSLLKAPILYSLQRKNARFANSCLMVTLLGGIVSDGLTNYQEISGVGGQYDFVSMADQIEDARSIIFCRSTRTTKLGVQTNIVWEYGNNTIPRYLRDIIVTEYGIADCRSKTDSEVIKALLNITDSRFQQDLLNKAKHAGKIAKDYQIPLLYKQNFPEKISAMLIPWQEKGYFDPYPFGSDLTEEEQFIAKKLLLLKNYSSWKLIRLILSSLFKTPTSLTKTRLERLQLWNVKNIKELFYKKILISIMQ